ncbi:MAG: aldehyde ferredoxin oxidoreductase family protein [Chloroflexota bacterium]|nr:aldehyde ferredoxin oxidoreductase family protein [Chloroflexota bacterium]
MSRSFHNRVLRVNLTSGEVEVERPGEVYFRRYLGGWNLIADVLLREVPAGVDPLGPQNKLVFAPGVITGLPVSGASRNAVGARSPLTGGFGAAEVGGFWGAELKQAGFDAVIVEGASEGPVYMWINDGDVEIRDAAHLWGEPTKETLHAVREELDDDRARCAMIGPAGENLVRFACIMNGLYDAAGRTGLGAVMGSKNLKAIAVRGTHRLEGANPDTVRAMARRAAQEVRDGTRAAGLHQFGTGAGLESSVEVGNLPIRNFRDGKFPDAADISAENYLEEIGAGMDACWACAVRCKKVVEAHDPYPLDSAYGGPEYESVAALGSCCGVDDIVTVAKATELCNANSLDTISTGVMIAFAMECFENGLLTTDDTDGLELRFGNGDAVVEMVRRIAHREGLGDFLADGHEAAVWSLGEEARAFALESKNQPYPMHEPRYKRGLAIGYAVSPTGADHVHSFHDIGVSEPDEAGFVRKEQLRALGVLEPMTMESLGPDKVRASLRDATLTLAENCLLMCIFPGWHVTDLARMVEAATGWSFSTYELMKVGERAATLARIYNLREGFTADDDRLAQRSHGPTRDGALVDGGIDPQKLQDALQTYYAMLGWAPQTGIPTLAKLHDLDIAWAAAHLPP